MSSGTSTPSLASTAELNSAAMSVLRARPYKFATQCVTVENPSPSHQNQFGASSVPIYQTATFKGLDGEYDYSRSGNPTRTHLEHHIAKISGAAHALVVTSGMGALDVIFRLASPGDDIIAGTDLYGGSNRLLTYLRTNGGLNVHHVDTTKLDAVETAIAAASRVSIVLLESPTNPLVQIVDLERIAALAHARFPDALVVVDNTMMSPYLQRPLEFGADIVYDSATKYLSGHHDLMAGAIVSNREDVHSRLAFIVNAVGNALPPFDAFLLLRGIKTLALRLDRQQASAQAVARYLHALGFRVNYPGLPGFPGNAIHARLASGPGAVMSFETGDTALSERIVAATRLWGVSVSFGCVNSLISMPCQMSHASIDPAVRKERNLPEDLIRLCVGIEDPEDLIDDLEAALFEAGAIRVVDEAIGARGGARLAVERVPGAGSTSDSVASLATPDDIVVSAPGKVILFGEHAVVHGVPALAGSVDLRCYAHIRKTQTATLKINLPDLSISVDVNIVDLPWNVRDLSPKAPAATAEPDPVLVAALTEQIATLTSNATARVSLLAAYYLFMHLFRFGPNRAIDGVEMTFRTALPIGAGLGSSAAFSVCTAAALLCIEGHVKVGAVTDALRSLSLDTPASLAPGSLGTSLSLVNAWAFTAEKIIHGTPSGLDNTAATFGGALRYARGTTPEQIAGVQALRLLLTDSRVPRDTRTLVAHVGQRKAAEPDLVGPIFTDIARISAGAAEALRDADRSAQLAALNALIDENHTHLVSLGVGHSELERIRALAGAHGLHSKLTGAGGGGCMYTLVPDEFGDDQLAALRAELENCGYRTYATTVGGRGCGVHVPVEGGASSIDLTKVSQEELTRWADALGAWEY